MRPGERPSAERAAATVLIEELEARTGIRLKTTSTWTAEKTAIAITSEMVVPAWGVEVPVSDTPNGPETRPEGFRLFVDKHNVVWVVGQGPRGSLYGVGALLRQLDWDAGKATIPADVDLATAPCYPIRGHQLGFRTQANSWDAWTPAQFDQYIRELALFGINSVENIPFQDDRPTPVMKVSRREMNRRMSEICARYGLDYWVWTPADYDLADAEARARALDDHEKLYRECKELTGVFFPGGDPGDNPPDLVLPFLEDIADRLLPQHPEARSLAVLAVVQSRTNHVHSSSIWTESRPTGWAAWSQAHRHHRSRLREGTCRRSTNIVSIPTSPTTRSASTQCLGGTRPSR